MFLQQHRHQNQIVCYVLKRLQMATQPSIFQTYSLKEHYTFRKKTAYICRCVVSLLISVSMLMGQPWPSPAGLESRCSSILSIIFHPLSPVVKLAARFSQAVPIPSFASIHAVLAVNPSVEPGCKLGRFYLAVGSILFLLNQLRRPRIIEASRKEG